MKLNQVIAIEKGVKSKVQSDVDKIAKMAQKPAAFDGLIKKYQKKSEDEEDVPEVKQNVQINATEALGVIAARWIELFDITAQKDYANCHATANVEIDGTVLIADASVSYLLFLEKQLTDLHTIIEKIPTLDPAERWTYDPNSGLNHTEPTLTTRTKKVQRGLVLHPPTQQHPAQTQLIVEDVSVGTWETTKFSGALPVPQHRKLLARIIQVLNAVKAAREAANMVDAPKLLIGEKLFEWVTRD